MIFLSLDLETNGLVPGRNGVATIGAVPVVRHRGAWDVNLTRTFYAELQPKMACRSIRSRFRSTA